eukprot:Pgem_evm1s8165
MFSHLFLTAKDKWHRTALYWAVYRSHVVAVSKLTSYHNTLKEWALEPPTLAHLKRRNNLWSTPTHVAIDRLAFKFNNTDDTREVVSTREILSAREVEGAHISKVVGADDAVREVVGALTSKVVGVDDGSSEVVGASKVVGADDGAREVVGVSKFVCVNDGARGVVDACTREVVGESKSNGMGEVVSARVGDDDNDSIVGCKQIKILKILFNSNIPLGVFDTLGRLPIHLAADLVCLDCFEQKELKQ